MSRVLFFVTVIALAFAAGCESQELTEREQEAIHTALETGATFEDDPYVRAETMRVLEMLGDPELSSYAADRAMDSAPMVRVAALRVLLSTGHKDARSRTIKGFGAGDGETRHAVLKAALEYGSAPLKRELTARALRSSNDELRRFAFEQGELARVREAVAAKKTKYLERNLFPELQQRVTKADDPLLASMALETLLDAGETDRAEPLIRQFNKAGGSIESRVGAARILAGAHAAVAEPHFVAVIEQRDETLNDDSKFEVPDEMVSPEILRAAVIGAVAAGNTTYVDRAQDYRKKATAEQTLEILEAMGRNKSPVAAIALKNAMQDARPAIRHRAIDLYIERDDMEPGALINAMKAAPFETQRRLAEILSKRFRSQWIEALNTQVQSNSEADATLLMLRNLITTRDEADKILKALIPALERVSQSDKEERAAMASYLLALVSKGVAADQLISKLDTDTVYAYLEFATRTQASANIELFRRYLYHDNFGIRLMASAGLWKGFHPSDAETPAPPAAPEADG